MSRQEAVFEGTSYADNTRHHRVFTEAILAELPLHPGSRILDLGSGAGDLTTLVADRVDVGTGSGAGYVLGLDASPDLVRHAQEAWGRPGLDFRVGLAQDLSDLVPAASFDVVLSVAVLHWVPAQDQARVLAGVARALRPGGVVRIDMGGRGQIRAAQEMLDELSGSIAGPLSPWFFPDEQTYRDLLTAAGLRIRRAELVSQRRNFPDPEAFKGWLCSQVLPAYLQGLPEASRAAFTADAVAQGLQRLRRSDGSFDQDYVRLDVLADRD